MSEHPLTRLYFYLTEGCNLACRHCWLAPKLDPTASRYPTLPIDAFEGILAEAKPLGLTGVKLTGGEPLLHPQIERLLEIVQREALSLTVETNGLLCTPALAAEIARAPHPFVSVSLDGVNAETQEWIRGVAGSFRAATQAVRVLAEAGLTPQIVFSLLPQNVNQVDALLPLAESLGAASIKFNVIQPTARGSQLYAAESTVSIGELIALGRRVNTELAPKTRMRLVFDYPMAFRPLRQFASGGGGRCGILGILGVLADGHYALCGIGENVPELVFGQFGQDALETVWRETAMLQALRSGLPGRLSGVCGQCLMKTMCLGACVAQNYYRTRDLFGPYWFCEMAQELGLFPDTRRLV